MQIERKHHSTVYRKMFGSPPSSGATEKILVWEKSHAKTVAWFYDMDGHAKKCVDCERSTERSTGVSVRLSKKLLVKVSLGGGDLLFLCVF